MRLVPSGHMQRLVGIQYDHGKMVPVHDAATSTHVVKSCVQDRSGWLGSCTTHKTLWLTVGVELPSVA